MSPIAIKLLSSASRLGCIGVATIGLLASACAYGEPTATNDGLAISGKTGNEIPNEQSPMTAEQEAKVKLLREAIDLGLGFGKKTLGDEINIEMQQSGISVRYDPTTITGKSYKPPQQGSCPFLTAGPVGSNVDCRSIATKATVSAYTRMTAIQAANPLDDRFSSIKQEGDFWYSEGFATGIDNEATAAIYVLRDQKLCDQSPKPEQSAYDSGVERGRELYIEELNKRLVQVGMDMHYPDKITQLQVCSANTSLLEPARVRAIDDAAAYAKANPLCSSYNPSTKEDIARLDEAEKQYDTGMRQGIDVEHSLAGELIFKVVPCNTGDPLVLDLAGNGVEIVGMEQSRARFDLFGTGTVAQVSWVRGDDALLAIDRNGNGTIDNGRELFGNFVGERGFEEVSSGFAHLAAYDQPCMGGNADGAITSSDAIYTKLVLWQDADGNGVSAASELHSLAEMGVTSIDLHPIASTVGQVSHRANFTRASWAADLVGSSTGQIVDAWFDHGRSRVR
ncbi:MAG: hypothetical protein HY898_11570 [Deltaproteobacteria bacterium]|nr:hypothetical protein [Deltaproteobacteria bacterium]